jgi:hypothetical protein
VELLVEFEDNPLLLQIMTVASRCLALPAVTTPLKTALTGLELLMARAQVRLSFVGQVRVVGRVRSGRVRGRWLDSPDRAGAARGQRA